MAGITLAQAEAKLTLWLTAEEALQTAQSYELQGGISVTRADLDKIGRRIDFWNRQVQALTRGSSIRIVGGTPT